MAIRIKINEVYYTTNLVADTPTGEKTYKIELTAQEASQIRELLTNVKNGIEIETKHEEMVYNLLFKDKLEEVQSIFVGEYFQEAVKGILIDFLHFMVEKQKQSITP